MVDQAFSWGDDAPPRTPLEDTVIYEVHVKGFTKRHPEVAEELRGTYAGMSAAPAIEYLAELGITAVELLPVHQHVDEHHLVTKGLRNYWGYNTIGFFAPDVGYAATDDPVGEFKSMVRRYHDAGIEVILDVVYNHTGESNHLGPTLSFRGIDNEDYYRLDPDDRRYYVDYTGTGNTLDATSPRVLQPDHGLAALLDHRDARRRLPLRPRIGPGPRAPRRRQARQLLRHHSPGPAHQPGEADRRALGRRAGWLPGRQLPGRLGRVEWQVPRQRSTLLEGRSASQTGELAYRLTGSSDLYAGSGRQPHASINFVTSHDGFTLNDLVSYEAKHNEANGEDNRDGDDDNNSLNFGVEGETDDEAVIEARERQKRSLLATLLLSQGVPMLLGGDEIGRTQGGNNNGYAQDNEISWFDWDLKRRDRQLLAFTRALVHLFRAHPVLRRRRFFQGRQIRGSRVKDLTWFALDGTRDDRRAVAGAGRQGPGPPVRRRRDQRPGPARRANHRRHAPHHPQRRRSAGRLHAARITRLARRWEVVFDTVHPTFTAAHGEHDGGAIYRVAERSVVCLRRLPRVRRARRA